MCLLVIVGLESRFAVDYVEVSLCLFCLFLILILSSFIMCCRRLTDVKITATGVVPLLKATVTNITSSLFSKHTLEFVHFLRCFGHSADCFLD